MKRIVSIGVAFIAILLVLVMSESRLIHLGSIDFRAYWSASYLLAHGENFADPQ